MMCQQGPGYDMRESKKNSTMHKETERESFTSAAKQKQKYSGSREEAVLRLKLCRRDRRMKSDTR